MRKEKLKKTVLAAMLLSVGIVLPLFTSQIKEIGDSLLPMHIPVMLCGLICGGNYGFITGLMLPFVRSMIFGMPPMYPNAVWMALELASYGIVIGITYKKSKKVLLSLVLAMLSGRIVWGVAKAVLLGLGRKPFGVMAFISGGFIDAFPGIIIQLILIPLVMRAVEKRRNKK